MIVMEVKDILETFDIECDDINEKLEENRCLN